jgi:hypothetical protein
MSIDEGPFQNIVEIGFPQIPGVCGPGIHPLNMRNNEVAIYIYEDSEYYSGENIIRTPTPQPPSPSCVLIDSFGCGQIQSFQITVPVLKSKAWPLCIEGSQTDGRIHSGYWPTGPKNTSIIDNCDNGVFYQEIDIGSKILQLIEWRWTATGAACSAGWDPPV